MNSLFPVALLHLQRAAVAARPITAALQRSTLLVRHQGSNIHPKWFRSRHSIIYDMEVRERPLNAIMTDRGFGGWPAALKNIKRGYVHVNGRKRPIRTNIRMRTDIPIELKGKVLQPVPILAICHKPLDVEFPTENPWENEELKESMLHNFPYLYSMHPVDRFDTDSSGLLLFSKSGFATKAIMELSSNLEREYTATVMGTVNAKEMNDKLTAGVDTSEGKFAAKLVTVRHITDEEKLNEARKRMKVVETHRITRILQKARAKAELPDLEGGELDAEIDRFMSKDMCYQSASEVQFIVTEPRHRMACHMLNNTGHPVITLHRTRVGELSMDDLEVGKVRAVNEKELAWFTEWATEYDVKKKAEMQRLFELEQIPRREHKQACKAAVRFARDEANALLARMRQTEKSRYKNMVRRRVLWPENLSYAPGSDEELAAEKESDIRARDVKMKIAQRLAEYAEEKGEALSTRALKQVTKVVNKAILADRKEEKKRERMRKKKMEKAKEDQKLMGKPPTYYYS